MKIVAIENKFHVETILFYFQIQVQKKILLKTFKLL